MAAVRDGRADAVLAASIFHRRLHTIDEVKRDMELPKPMDRLICGDVGYGKTEIAVRAAFKAVMDGKQVAVLVPTTLLAEQHQVTFTERLAPFPRRDVIAALIERTLLQHAAVWIGAGSPAHMAMLAPSDLQRLAGARTADVVVRS